MQIFHNAFTWIKTHPLYIVLGLGLIFIVYMATRGSGSSDSGTTYAMPGQSDAAIAAGTQLQLAQVGANAQNYTTQAQLAAVNTQTAAALTAKTLDAANDHYQIEQSANVQTLGIEASKDVQLAGFQTQQAIQVANLATQAEIASLSADVTKTNYEEQTKQLSAVITGNVLVAQSHDNATVAITQSNNSVQKQKSNNGLLGGIIGGILSIF